MPEHQRDFLNLLLNQYWFAPPVALWRAIELRILAEQPFPHPILDLGCGDGLIAEVLFDPRIKNEVIEFGFDPWLEQVLKAPQSQSYRYTQQAFGAAMPYASNQFACVFSNSVLEHIPDLEPVLKESARVLQPGGRFMATVPSDAFRTLLAGYQDRAKTGDLESAEMYAAQVDQRLEHHRYPSPVDWAGILSAAGLTMISHTYYIPASVMDIWDRANRTYGIHEDSPAYYRWLVSPRLRKFRYQNLVKRWVINSLNERWREAYDTNVAEGDVGGGLLIVAEKRRS